MKVICCKFSASQWKIGRRYFLRSFSAREQRASAKAISKRCSKPSSANKAREAIYKKEEDRPCRISKNMEKSIENITSVFIATSRARLTRTKGLRTREVSPHR